MNTQQQWSEFHIFIQQLSNQVREKALPQTRINKRIAEEIDAIKFECSGNVDSELDTYLTELGNFNFGLVGEEEALDKLAKVVHHTLSKATED